MYKVQRKLKVKRILLIGLALSLAVGMTAQEKYNVLLERIAPMTPYEAIYVLMDYQQDKPENASVYYQLGNRCYGLLDSRDALHDYRELSELLYRSRLFYGNCLHFAKDQKLPGWQYAEIANGEKKIDYAALEAYIRPRMDDVARRQTACDSIHRSLYRLVEQYNSCQAMYHRFLELYTREKTAHLELTATQRSELEQLARESAKLPGMIAAYEGALALGPISGYNPTFRWMPIELYRLDGLTNTDFMQNDVALWDYSAWVSHFLQEQRETYEQLYRDVESEHERLTLEIKRYRVGARVTDRTDESVVGRCRRLELTSEQAQALPAMQTVVRIAAIEQELANSKSPKTVREMLPLLQLAQEGLENVRRDDVQSTKGFAVIADSAQNLIRAHIVRLATPLASQMTPTHVSQITGAVSAYSADYGQKVYHLMNTIDGWRCVLTDDIANETQVLALTGDLAPRATLLKTKKENPLLLTEMAKGQWALVTDKNCYFFKEQRD